jgi:hypothetical protein
MNTSEVTATHTNQFWKHAGIFLGTLMAYGSLQAILLLSGGYGTFISGSNTFVYILGISIALYFSFKKNPIQSISNALLFATSYNLFSLIVETSTGRNLFNSYGYGQGPNYSQETILFNVFAITAVAAIAYGVYSYKIQTWIGSLLTTLLVITSLVTFINRFVVLQNTDTNWLWVAFGLAGFTILASGFAVQHKKVLFNFLVLTSLPAVLISIFILLLPKNLSTGVLNGINFLNVNFVGHMILLLTSIILYIIGAAKKITILIVYGVLFSSMLLGYIDVVYLGSFVPLQWLVLILSIFIVVITYRYSTGKTSKILTWFEKALE